MARRSNGVGLPTRVKSTPIATPRTNRPQEYRVLTSMNAGKMVPIAAIPLLREDAMQSGNFRVAFEMDETVEVLMNAVNVRVMAYLVPKLAFERYDSMDDINRSYEGVAKGTNPVVPWFETMVVPATIPPLLVSMGKHVKVGSSINTDVIEAYNAIWNLRATNRSADIPLRTRLDTSLAPAFWQHQTFSHIVPNFDQAIIDGEVPLNVVNARLPVKGIGKLNKNFSAVTQNVWETDATATTAYTLNMGVNPAGADGTFYVKGNGTTANGVPDIFAELQENGITVSLSNIELARKTQAFAQLRRQYSGHDDEFLIDLLMDGISIPEQDWKKPLLLADVNTVFGMSKRYASDAANLTESVVNGGTFVDFRIRTPRCPMGGMVMIVAEIAPEQLFERQKDPYITATTVAELPQYLRDELDPEKVSVVTNDYIDINHATPTATFGYAPLNHQWAKSQPNVGGRFYRPDVDGAFDEDRQRIWAVETANPVLSEDFYLVSEMNYKPFVVTDVEVDHFEVLLRGQCNINGLTVFGGLLIEAYDDYAEVLEEAPQDRIDQPPPAE